MHHTVRAYIVTCIICLSAASSAIPGAAAETTQFRVTLDAATSQRPITGRLYVFLSQRPGEEPVQGPNWFSPEPFFAVDVKGFAPGEARVLDDTADGFPDVLSKVPAGRYRAQALLDHDFYWQHHAHGPGNLHSDVVEIDVDPQRGGTFDFALERVIAERTFPETERVREIVIRSELLSKFHGREVLDRAAVVLPDSYGHEPNRRYPTVYIIPGFGGSHRQALRYSDNPPPVDESGVEFIRVMLSGNCKWGHHVYADSATNGPRGEALISELIPHVDRTFRTVDAATARFVTGHSSGGWSALWLQVSYPGAFGGVWSTSPDPVDFRDYQQVNLYADPPRSLYTDEHGAPRPIARRGERPVLWYETFGRMDDVLGRGGQLRSFEAVFSPLGADGLPRKLWDRRTGRIDPEVARAWEAYDIRLKLERNWPQLAPKLQGKLHITTGSLDTFYLEGAVELLARTLEQLGSDAQVKVLPGEDHSSLLTPQLHAKMRRQMAAAFLRHHRP